jgi:hypothetical protein
MIWIKLSVTWWEFDAWLATLQRTPSALNMIVPGSLHGTSCKFSSPLTTWKYTLVNATKNFMFNISKRDDQSTQYWQKFTTKCYIFKYCYLLQVPPEEHASQKPVKRSQGNIARYWCVGQRRRQWTRSAHVVKSLVRKRGRVSTSPKSLRQHSRRGGNYSVVVHLQVVVTGNATRVGRHAWSGRGSVEAGRAYPHRRVNWRKRAANWADWVRRRGCRESRWTGYGLLTTRAWN